MITMRKNFIEKLFPELWKQRDNTDANSITFFCEDALRHLEDDADEECKTNQYYASMKESFCRSAAID